jgi:hypothetical protein
MTRVGEECAGDVMQPPRESHRRSHGGHVHRGAHLAAVRQRGLRAAPTPPIATRRARVHWEHRDRRTSPPGRPARPGSRVVGGRVVVVGDENRGVGVLHQAPESGLEALLDTPQPMAEFVSIDTGVGDQLREVGEFEGVGADRLGATPDGSRPTTITRAGFCGSISRHSAPRPRRPGGDSRSHRRRREGLSRFPVDLAAGDENGESLS